MLVVKIQKYARLKKIGTCYFCMCGYVVQQLWSELVIFIFFIGLLFIFISLKLESHQQALNTESHVHENMESLQLFFFPLLYFGHSTLSFFVVLFSSQLLNVCLTQVLLLVSFMYGPAFSVSQEFHPFLHLLPIASVHIITITLRLVQTLFLNLKAACSTFLTVCLESFLISRYQKLNLFSLHIFPLPLVTNILSVSQAQNLGIRFVSTLSFAFYIQTTSKSHIHLIYASFVLFFLIMSSSWLICLASTGFFVFFPSAL